MAKINKMRAWRTLLYLVLLSLAIMSAGAQPVPHGVDGYIHELDDVTPVGGVNFSIYNVDTQEYFQGITRGNGYYSVALNGDNGDLIIIKTWTKYHQTEKNLTLQGVMHNVNLILNTSIPDLPPEVTSTPVTTAQVSMPYEYQITASDPNKDTIVFSLLISPDKMTISKEGLIEWVPKNKDKGINNVTVNVSDSKLHTLHTFDIMVSEKKSSESQITYETTEVKQTSKDTVQTPLSKQGEPSVQELSVRPEQTKPFDKKVYKYLKITKPHKIEVKVEINWLIQNNAKKEDIILSQYKDNHWQEIPVSIVDEDQAYIYYEADISTSGYLAISLNSIIEPNRTVITGPKEPHIIAGTIFQNQRQVAEGTTIKITNNRTGEVSQEKTGLAKNTGAFYALIHGNNGDKIDLEVKKGFTYQKKTIILDGDIKNLNLLLTSEGLFSITGLATAPATASIGTFIVIITVFLLLSLILTMGRMKESKSNNTIDTYKRLR